MEDDARPTRTALAWSDPAGELHTRTVESFASVYPALMDAATRVIRRSRPEKLADVELDLPARAADGAPVHMHQIMLLPLRARGRTLGILLLGCSFSGRRYGSSDVALAEETVSLCSGEAFAFGVNVADEDGVRALMAATAERFGGIDVLYNNAGISPDDDASVLDTSVEAWDRVQDVNTKGVFLCCKHGIPYLRERGGGSVINVASFVAIVGAATSQISYTASKGAVLSMSRELAVQFARDGIRVNALCPGPVETPLLLNIFGDDPAALERRRIHWPTGRLAKPREVVNGALFLASDESSYVNGSTFLVDGGLTASYVTPE